MSNGQETVEESVSLLSRRELLGASAALGTAAIASGSGAVGSADAQTTTEPRIQLGEDYAIDDDPDGEGDLVLEHLPSGSEFRYDSSEDEWTTESFSADGVRAGSVDGAGSIPRLVDRQNLVGDSSQIQFSNLSNDVEYVVFIDTLVDGAVDVFLRVNNDGSGTGIYSYWDSSSTKQTAQDEFLIAATSGTAPLASNITVTNTQYTNPGREGFNNRFLPSRSENINNFGREGGRDNSNDSLSSIEIMTDGLFVGGRTVAELWGRQY